MSLAATGGHVPGIVEAYLELIGSPAFDEFLAPDGTVRDGWRDLADTAGLLGGDGLLDRAEAARRLVEDDGVTYGDGGTWRLDPLPVVLGPAEWQGLAAGLAQRAELLDLVLTDLYGERRLLRDRVLPPEIVLGHAGFLRECDGLRLPGPRQLVLWAADVIRGRDGWCVLGDRTQAPSGAGYAMANRRIVARVLPGLYRDAPLQRLRAFFHAVREAAQDVAPRTAEVPKVVILTPGPGSETAFDQSFLAALLGFQLVEGRDLTVRDGRVWLRSLGRPEPVDVVLRRVDSWFVDPLELRPDSYLGVPGLLQAARLGSVSLVNTPGSGVLENPALAAHLPALAHALLGEPLRLPSVPTWWCGDPGSRRHVLARLDELVIRPIARGSGRANLFGPELSAAGRDALARRIEAEPHAWCGQEAVEPSTVPAVTARDDRPGHGFAPLEPRRMVLRAFGVARGDGYRLLDGGLARIASAREALVISSQGGALAKDVWVLQPRDVPSLEAVPPLPADLAAEAPPLGAVSARVAEDLFWLGRYAERAEDAARLVRVVADVAGDHAGRPDTPAGRTLAVLLRALTGVTTTYSGFTAGPQLELVRVTVDASAPGTVAHAVRHTVEAAQSVRELLSPDTWIVLGGVERAIASLARRADDPDLPLQTALTRVLEGLLALAGLGAESMVRDAGWYVMDAGRRIERAQQVVALLRHTLCTPADDPAPAGELLLESVLIAAESVITHRRREPGRPRPASVLALLLLDRDNPRAVAHQLLRLGDDLRRLPPGRPSRSGAPEPDRELRDLLDRLRAAGPEIGDDAPGLAAMLDDVGAGLRRLGDAVAAAHFARDLPPQPMPVKPALELR